MTIPPNERHRVARKNLSTTMRTMHKHAAAGSSTLLQRAEAPNATPGNLHAVIKHHDVNAACLEAVAQHKHTDTATLLAIAQHRAANLDVLQAIVANANVDNHTLGIIADNKNADAALLKQIVETIATAKHIAQTDPMHIPIKDEHAKQKRITANAKEAAKENTGTLFTVAQNLAANSMVLRAVIKHPDVDAACLDAVAQHANAQDDKAIQNAIEVRSRRLKT